MCRIAITLAAEVTMITASTNRKLPKVSWPMESENVRFFSGVGVNSADIGAVEDRAIGVPIYDGLRPRGNTPQDGEHPKYCRPAAPSPSAYDGLTLVRGRAGIVMAATPRTTQPSPIQAVWLKVSPRKATLMATPIGTRR